MWYENADVDTGVVFAVAWDEIKVVCFDADDDLGMLCCSYSKVSQEEMKVIRATKIPEKVDVKWN